MKRNTVIPTIITDSLKTGGTIIDNTVATVFEGRYLGPDYRMLSLCAPYRSRIRHAPAKSGKIGTVRKKTFQNRCQADHFYLTRTL